MCCPPVEEDRAIKHVIEPGVSPCPAKQYSSCTIYGACRWRRKFWGTPARWYNCWTSQRSVPGPRGSPSPCRCSEEEAMMDYSRFSHCSLPKTSFIECEWDNWMYITVHYCEHLFYGAIINNPLTLCFKTRKACLKVKWGEVVVLAWTIIASWILTVQL